MARKASSASSTLSPRRLHRSLSALPQTQPPNRSIPPFRLCAEDPEHEKGSRLWLDGSQTPTRFCFHRTGGFWGRHRGLQIHQSYADGLRPLINFPIRVEAAALSTARSFMGPTDVKQEEGLAGRRFQNLFTRHAVCASDTSTRLQLACFLSMLPSHLSWTESRPLLDMLALFGSLLMTRRG